MHTEPGTVTALAAKLQRCVQPYLACPSLGSIKYYQGVWHSHHRTFFAFCKVFMLVGDIKSDSRKLTLFSGSVQGDTGPACAVGFVTVESWQACL